MGIVLIQGAESLLADRAISQVIATKTGAQTSIFSADELEVGFITDSLAPSLFADARVVDQDIDPAELGCSLGNCGRNLLFISNVALNR